MKLYGYFRSSAAYRVRIVLGLKSLAYEQVSVHLARGEQRDESYAKLNPQRLIPTLEDRGHVLTQSLAIIEYLDEVYPMPPLLPAEPAERARVRGLALAVACEIHPLNNLRVFDHLSGTFGANDEQRLAWYHYWIAEGLTALEHVLVRSPETGRFCHGDHPTLADVFLVPQVFNARRYHCDLERYPTIVRIEQECLKVPAFDRARPENQPDAA